MRTLITILICSPFVVFGQLNNLSGIWGTHMDKANQLFENKLYEESITYYKKELEVYTFSERAVQRIADAYFYLGDYKHADDYYTLLFAIDKENNDSAAIYMYAESLMSTGRYQLANSYYSKFLEIAPDDPVVIEKLEGLHDIYRYYRDTAQHELHPFPFNSERIEMGVVPYKNGWLFTSAREKDLIIKHDHLREAEALLDLYHYNPETQDIKRVKLPHHFKSNDGPAIPYSEGLIVGRNIGYNEQHDSNSLGLFFFKDEDGELELIRDYSFNSPKYSIMHPSLSAGEDTLYFASDMPGGYGKRDIYYSVKIGRKWQEPVNLGPGINTRADEVFPFFKDDTLYFSSNGHAGLGGLDVFRFADGTLSNVGSPVNSGFDDFGYYKQSQEGFFSSNRPGGKGHDDVYAFVYTPPPPYVPAVLTIQVKDSLSWEPLPLTIAGGLDNLHSVTKTESSITMEVDRTKYSFDIGSEGYNTQSVHVDMTDLDQRTLEVLLMPDISLEALNPDSILFRYNAYILSQSAEQELDHIVELMQKYPNLQLTISAHTDSRGEAAYNLNLSKQRAQSTAAYLEKHGIAMHRIITNGYGESKLLNDCIDGVACSEQEHLVNRRIEFELNY